jgi:hypothetical protein
MVFPELSPSLDHQQLSTIQLSTLFATIEIQLCLHYVQHLTKAVGGISTRTVIPITAKVVPYYRIVLRNVLEYSLLYCCPYKTHVQIVRARIFML